MTRLLVAVLLVGACTCGETTREEPPEVPEVPEGDVATLAEYFPAALGDRWRLGSGEDRTTRAVIAREGDVAVILGDDLTGPMQVRIGADAITMLAPDGSSAGDVLQAPMVLDHQWAYDVGDVSCEARYAQMDQIVEIADLTVQACVLVRRRCVHPPGKPFPEETVEAHEETYCPFIGRVAETLALDPAPMINGQAIEARRDDRLLFYRVAGAPSPTHEPFDCDGLLLTPIDVSSACGGQLQITEARTENGRCTLGFSGTSGELRVVAQQGVDPVSLLDGDASPRGEAFVVRGEEHNALALGENGYAVAVMAPTAACSADSLDLMEPLLRSLVRR